MIRRRHWLVVTGLTTLIVLVTACGGETDTGGEPAEATAAPSPTTAAPAPTSAPDTTAASDPASTESAAAPEAPADGPETTTSTTAAPAEPLGPPAPDFTLQLHDGGTFVLSQQTTPVLMIFWAEW